MASVRRNVKRVSQHWLISQATIKSIISRKATMSGRIKRAYGTMRPFGDIRRNHVWDSSLHRMGRNQTVKKQPVTEVLKRPSGWSSGTGYNIILERTASFQTIGIAHAVPFLIGNRSDKQRSCLSWCCGKALGSCWFESGYLSFTWNIRKFNSKRLFYLSQKWKGTDYEHVNRLLLNMYHNKINKSKEKGYRNVTKITL